MTVHPSYIIQQCLRALVLGFKGLIKVLSVNLMRN